MEITKFVTGSPVAEITCPATPVQLQPRSEWAKLGDSAGVPNCSEYGHGVAVMVGDTVIVAVGDGPGVEVRLGVEVTSGVSITCGVSVSTGSSVFSAVWQIEQSMVGQTSAGSVSKIPGSFVKLSVGRTLLGSMVGSTMILIYGKPEQPARRMAKINIDNRFMRKLTSRKQHSVDAQRGA